MGWKAVASIAKRHDVRVLVHEMNRPDWERSGKLGEIPPNVRVRFVAGRAEWHTNRLMARIQSWTRYLQFSKAALAEAMAWHAEEPADLVHQVTYATWRVASPLWQMPIPLVWGPLGGAAVFPRKFLSILGTSSKLFELVREFSGMMAVRNRGLRRCLRNAAVVIAANQETLEFLAPLRPGPLLKVPVTSVVDAEAARLKRPARAHADPSVPLRLFAGGNIGGSKGVSLALRAVAKLKQQGVAVHYLIAGGGPELATLEALADALGITAEVTFHPGFAGADYVRALQESDVYFLPSFRETMPITLIEAILAGCYPVVADASAPGEIVRLVGGDAVPVESPDQVVAALVAAIVRLDRKRDGLAVAAEKIRQRVIEQFGADVYDAGIEQAYQLALQGR